MSSTSSSAPSEVFGGFCSLLGLTLERFQFQSVDLLLGERRERVAAARRALSTLKGNQRLALVLQASGYSYEEILETCGWTYTKGNLTFDRLEMVWLPPLDLGVAA